MANLCTNEVAATRALFTNNPNKSFCRLDIVGAINKPISNVCRIVYNLVNEGFIEVVKKDKSPYTGAIVEFLRLKNNSQLSIF
ncbi:hypothetical protein [Bacteroides sp. GM023]|uniref:hypothetical protein n=1 Tax=Bacteroides sp. GM023 TaxID=2723058 RepID=UPI00168BDBC3|nr:hypothetical protein [Bacteroides sp. GM023]MBD3591584.1 hypothetical protein [Bacteroides sp. GM023]